MVVLGVNDGHDALDAQKSCGKNEGEYHGESVVDAAAQTVLRCGRIDVHYLAPQATPRCKPNFIGHLFIELGQKLRPVRFQVKIHPVS